MSICPSVCLHDGRPSPVSPSRSRSAPPPFVSGRDCRVDTGLRSPESTPAPVQRYHQRTTPVLSQRGPLYSCRRGSNGACLTVLSQRGSTAAAGLSHRAVLQIESLSQQFVSVLNEEIEQLFTYNNVFPSRLISPSHITELSHWSDFWTASSRLLIFCVWSPSGSYSDKLHYVQAMPYQGGQERLHRQTGRPTLMCCVSCRPTH